MAALAARVDSLRKLVYHHTLEHPSLVIDVGEDVLPEHVEGGKGYEESVYTHPEAVSESDGCESDNENGD